MIAGIIPWSLEITLSNYEREREIVNDLAIMMCGQLRCNAHKDWEDVEVGDHFAMMVERTAALGELLKNGDGFDIAHIRRKCADIANFAAMIADTA